MNGPTPETPSAPPQNGAAPVPASSPFGWTGIRRERYTRWRGHLDGRRKIVLRMIQEGVRFNLKTWPVIILMVLGWMFTMFLPVFSAAGGNLPLEAKTPDTWVGSEPATAVMNRTIMNYSVAEYRLVGSAVTGATTYEFSQVPPNWGVSVNVTNEGGRPIPVLVVTPPAYAQPNTTAQIRVRAVNGLRADSYDIFTTIAATPELANVTSSYDFAFANDSFHGKAGGKSDVQFQLTNTGTLPDGYNITVTTIQKGWSIAVFINGTRIPVQQIAKSQNGFGDSEIVTNVIGFKLNLTPGETADCELRIGTTVDSPGANDIMVTVQSHDDQFSGGRFHSGLILSDIKEIDNIGVILYGQVMSWQVYFALILAAIVGSRMISTDLHEKSYNLYFARPLTKNDYIAGKFGTVGVILGLATIVPTMVTYSFLLLLSNISGSYVIDHLWVWGAIIGFGAVVVLTLATLSLAFSSLTARRFYAAAALVVIYLVTSIMGQIASGAFNSEYGRLIGVNDNFDVVGRTAFNTVASLDLKFPWYYSLGVLAVIWAACIFLVWYKIERTELSE